MSELTEKQQDQEPLSDELEAVKALADKQALEMFGQIYEGQEIDAETKEVTIKFLRLGFLQGFNFGREDVAQQINSMLNKNNGKN